MIKMLYIYFLANQGVKNKNVFLFHYAFKIRHSVASNPRTRSLSLRSSRVRKAANCTLYFILSNVTIDILFFEF